jgi:Arc/MetJ-type ribon-helix-helix transcriptional regulator
VIARSRLSPGAAVLINGCLPRFIAEFRGCQQWFDFRHGRRYTANMTHIPLTPRQERFIREQLATGRFQHESELFLAALELLEEQIEGPSTERREREVVADVIVVPAESARAASWDELREQLNQRTAGRDSAAMAPARRSPRGILADIRSHIDLDDIKEARREMWAGVSRRD